MKDYPADKFKFLFERLGPVDNGGYFTATRAVQIPL